MTHLKITSKSGRAIGTEVELDGVPLPHGRRLTLDIDVNNTGPIVAKIEVWVTQLDVEADGIVTTLIPFTPPQEQPADGT